MRKKAIAAGMALVVLLLAFLVGYWPQSRARGRAEAATQTLRQQRDAAEARLHVAALLGQVLTLQEVVVRRNYGQAQELSSKFFDTVRQQAMSISDSNLRDGLTAVLGRRDRITSALATSDPTVAGALQEVELEFRRSLNFMMPPASAP